MIKLKSLALIAALFIASSSYAAWDIWQAYLIVNVNGGGNTYWQAGLDGTDPTPSVVNRYFGRFSSGQTLVIDGSEMKTYKNGSSNVCGGKVSYRVYRTCDTPGSFTQINNSFVCNFPCTGLNSTGDQKWGTSGFGANVLSGLTASGTYVIEMYWEITGGDTGGCATTKYASNGGVNFRAYFEYEVNDSFTDGDFSATPAWTGDTGSWTVVSNSDAAGLIGTESTRSQTVRLNTTGTSPDYISTTLNNWNYQQEWYFFVGRRSQSATAANQTIVWLYANEANLESATVDGYRIVIGDDVGGDEIVLEKVTNGVGTAIFTSTQSITNNIIDWGLTFKVTRRSTGRWQILTSTIPTSSGAGATAWSCPDALSTVTLTNSLIVGNPSYAIDNTYAPPQAGTGYFGIAATHGSSAGEVAAMEFDNLRVRMLPADTYVSISGTTNSSIAENSNCATVIALDIANYSTTVATTVQLVLTSGSATRFGGNYSPSNVASPTCGTVSLAPSYSTVTVTWNANDNATKYVYLDPDNNSLCDDVASITLQLQNPSGGLNAYVGATDTYSWTITDDDYGYQTLISDDFNDGNLTSPAPSWVSVPTSSYNASTTTPINGAYSMRSVFTGTSGSNSATIDCDGATLPGQTSTWRFNVQYNLEPSPANKFMVFLAANEANLWSATVDGYALGVNPISSGDADILTLWRIDNGAPGVAIVTTTLDWGIAQNIVGFEITRSESGLWTLKMDSDGNFDNLVTQGTSATETTYASVDYFGPRCIYTASNGAKLALDDVSFAQKGCRSLYYSRASGNWTDAIWSTQATGGTITSLNSGRYTRIVIQDGHTVALNSNQVANDITINSGTTGGVINASSNTLTVYGNWINNGTFNAQTGTVILKGDATQNIQGSANTSFNNLTIDNDAGTVNCNVACGVTGVVSPIEGTIQANGNLTLISTATGSGSIGEIKSGADVSGNIILQRYIPLASAGWVFLGCPLLGKTVADWDDDIIVTGYSNANDGYNAPGYTWVNIYWYDESVAGARNLGWKLTNGNSSYPPAPSTADAFLSNKGYNVYVQAAAQTVDVTGTIQKGDVTIPVSYTNSSNTADGWNLVVNPYPSEVDWVAVEGNSSDVGTYYVYDSALPGYRAYNANTLTGSASRYIAHSQSFFVKTTGVGQNLNFKESHKTATNAAFERVLDETVREVYFRLEKTPTLADEGSLTFIDGATDNYESTYDAEYLQSSNNQAPEFALVSADNVLLELDARPNFTETMSIPVFMDLPSAGTYTFSVLSMTNIPTGSCISVEDVVAGTSVPLEVGASLTITVAAAYNGNRLIIHVSQPIAITSTDATCFGLENGVVDFAPAAGTWTYSVMNDMGTVTFIGDGTTNWNTAPAGHYLVTMNNSDEACGSFTYDVTINEPLPNGGWAEGSPDLCNMGMNGSIVFGVDNTLEYFYSVNDESGNTVQTGTTTEPYLEIIGLQGGIYTLNIQNACGTLNYTVDLNDPNAIDATIAASSTLVQFPEGSSVDVTLNADPADAVSYIWTYNSEVVGTESTLVYTVNTAGDHVFNVEVANNTCTDNAEVNVVGQIVAGVTENASQEDVTFAQINGAIQLTFHTLSSAATDIRIYDAQGRLVMKERGTGQTVTVNTTALSRGVYTVRVINGNSTVLTRKFVN